MPGASEHHSPLAQLIQGAALYRKTSKRGQPLQDKEGGSEFVVSEKIEICISTSTHIQTLTKNVQLERL